MAIYDKHYSTVHIVSQLFIILVLATSTVCSSELSPYFYNHTCPQALSIVKSAVKKAVEKEARMAGSLLRLHFHDCFVQGCDASLLLDDTPKFRGEKTSNPNNKSARGFNVIDDIKRQLESECPGTVSCADIVAIAARDSVVLTGGPEWTVQLGRRDSRSASFSGSNQNIPAPNSTLQSLITKFKRQGLDEVDLVALSGSHTIGQSRCTSFKQRLYNQTGNGKPDSTIQAMFLTKLKSSCPRSGGDNNLSPLDFTSPTKFDNHYFNNLKSMKGLLNSDEELYTKHNQLTVGIVNTYAADQKLFFKQFAKSMVKLGNIKPLTGSKGEIRHNCRRMN